MYDTDAIQEVLSIILRFSTFGFAIGTILYFIFYSIGKALNLVSL